MCCFAAAPDPTLPIHSLKIVQSASMRIGYLECFSGISGDMLLGAMVDAGVLLEEMSKAVIALNVGARLEARRVSRAGIAGTKVDVMTGESDDANADFHADLGAVKRVLEDEMGLRPI